MQALLGRGKCRVIIGLNGDGDADGPALALYDRLTGGDATTDDAMPLQRAVASNARSVTVAPDPVEEVRAVVRRIIAVADDVPFHRIAVAHRQESPYASLLRQELDFAGIPSSGIPRGARWPTPAPGGSCWARWRCWRQWTAAQDAEPTIDREQFIDLIMSCPVRFPPSSNASRRRPPLEVPATQWADLARARAGQRNGAGVGRPAGGLRRAAGPAGAGTLRRRPGGRPRGRNRVARRRRPRRLSRSTGPPTAALASAHGSGVDVAIGGGVTQIAAGRLPPARRGRRGGLPAH